MGLMASLFAIQSITFLDACGVSLVITLVPFFTRDLRLGAGWLGFITSLYGLFQIVGGLILGYTTSAFHVSRRHILLISAIGSGISYLMLFRADHLWVLIVSRILVGLVKQTCTSCKALIIMRGMKDDYTKDFSTLSAVRHLGSLVGSVIQSYLTRSFSWYSPISLSVGLFVVESCIILTCISDASPVTDISSKSHRRSVSRKRSFTDYNQTYTSPTKQPLVQHPHPHPLSSDQPHSRLSNHSVPKRVSYHLPLTRSISLNFRSFFRFINRKLPQSVQAPKDHLSPIPVSDHMIDSLTDSVAIGGHASISMNTMPDPSSSVPVVLTRSSGSGSSAVRTGVHLRTRRSLSMSGTREIQGIDYQDKFEQEVSIQDISESSSAELSYVLDDEYMRSESVLSEWDVGSECISRRNSIASSSSVDATVPMTSSFSVYDVSSVGSIQSEFSVSKSMDKQMCDYGASDTTSSTTSTTAMTSLRNNIPMREISDQPQNEHEYRIQAAKAREMEATEELSRLCQDPKCDHCCRRRVLLNKVRELASLSSKSLTKLSLSPTLSSSPTTTTTTTTTTTAEDVASVIMSPSLSQVALQQQQHPHLYETSSHDACTDDGSVSSGSVHQSSPSTEMFSSTIDMSSVIQPHTYSPTSIMHTFALSTSNHSTAVDLHTKATPSPVVGDSDTADESEVEEMRQYIEKLESELNETLWMLNSRPEGFLKEYNASHNCLHVFNESLRRIEKVHSKDQKNVVKKYRKLLKIPRRSLILYFAFLIGFDIINKGYGSIKIAMLQGRYDVTPVEIGYLYALVNLVTFVSEFVIIPWFTSGIRAFWSSLLSMVLMTFGKIFFLYCSSFWQYVIQCMVLNTVGEELFSTTFVNLFTKIIPPTRVSQYLSIYDIAESVCRLIGPIALGTLVSRASDSVCSWTFIVVSCALTCLWTICPVSESWKSSEANKRKHE